MKKQGLTNFLKITLYLIVFRLLLDYGYVKFVYPIFEYSGFDYNFNIIKYIISWLVIISLFSTLFTKKRSPLIYIYSLIYLISLLPASSYFALSGEGVESFWATSIVLFTLIIFLPSKPNECYIVSQGRQNKKIIFFIIAFISIINVLYLISSTGGQYVLSFEDVYDFREENAQSYSGIFGYLNNWTPKVFVPFLIAYGFVRNNKIIVLFAMILNLFLFAFTGHKSVLLPIILCIFLSISFKTDTSEKYFGRFIVLSLLGLIGFSIIGISLYFIKGEIIYGSIFFRRAFFVPVYLNGVYFDMFESLYAPIYWSNGLLSDFLNYPYGNEPITKIVGAYLNLPNLNANTGFIASGFMQARYYGIALYTLIIVIINYSLKRVSQRVDPLLFNAVLLLPLLTLFSSSDLPTTALTHGLLISIITLYLYSGILKFSSK